MSTLSIADIAAHEAGSYVRAVKSVPKPTRTVLAKYPAGGPRGQWPAESFAAEQRRNGIAAWVVMDLPTDSFLVIVEEVAR